LGVRNNDNRGEGYGKAGEVILAVAILFAGLFAGCAPSVSVQSKQYLGVPFYPPTNPVSVAILREPPARPHERIGEVTLEPDDNAPVSMIEQKLQQAAAQMGADAAGIVADRTMRMGAIISGPWYGREISPDLQRVVMAVAIKYT